MTDETDVGAIDVGNLDAEAFDRGQPIKVALVNKMQQHLPSWGIGVGNNVTEQLQALAQALQTQVTKHFAPHWGVNCVVKVFDNVPAGWWGMIFTDNADVANALGYHDLTPSGLPQGHVFVTTTINDGKQVSVTASHELLEMLVDPAINLCVQAADNDPNNAQFYAVEVSDAVEDTTYNIGNVTVSNFVFPSYFEGFRAPGSDRFDYMGLVTAPFQILQGGYMPVMVNGQWTQIFGSVQAQTAFKLSSRTRCPKRGCGVK